MTETLFVVDESMLAHDPGIGHPESPERLSHILDAVTRARLPHVAFGGAIPARPEFVEAVHDPHYVRHITSLRNVARAALDADTRLSLGSVDAAFLAAGAAIEAVDAVVTGRAKNAFVAARPPGHHAERARAMGFCIFNNVAIAAEYARRQLGLERILILDWDVHHGNGTQTAFYGRRDVLVCDLHRYPYYPGTGAVTDVGAGDGKGYTVNIPLPAGLGDGDYRAALEDVLAPIAASYQPELVLVSAGFDAHADDPLGDQCVTDDGFATLAAIARGIARDHCEGRIVLTLEGGYSVAALGRSVVACLQVLGGETPPPTRASTLAGGRAIREVLDVQSDFWRLS